MRRALVLGASGGIGAAIAQRLDADGFDVTVVARSGDGLARTLAAMSGGAAVTADLATDEGRDRLAGHLATEGQPHVVVGVVHLRRPWGRIVATDPAHYGAAVDDHLGHLVRIAHDALPFQRSEGFGRWILISSLVAAIGGHGQSVYITQKAAMEGFARALAVEEGASGITSNVVVPGFVDTENMARNYTPAQRDAFAACSVVGRRGRPEEVAHAVSFLADDRAGFVTGATIPVSGGAELNWWLVRSLRAAGEDA